MIFYPKQYTQAGFLFLLLLFPFYQQAQEIKPELAANHSNNALAIKLGYDSVSIRMNMLTSYLKKDTLITDKKALNDTAEAAWKLPANWIRLTDAKGRVTYIGQQDSLAGRARYERFYYNRKGQLSHKVQAGEKGKLKIVYTYDSRGRLVREKLPAYPDLAYTETRYSYDARGRLAMVERILESYAQNGPAGSGMLVSKKTVLRITKQYAADGLLESETIDDPDGVFFGGSGKSSFMYQKKK